MLSACNRILAWKAQSVGGSTTLATMTATIAHVTPVVNHCVQMTGNGTNVAYYPKKVTLCKYFGDEVGSKVYEVLSSKTKWGEYDKAVSYRLQCYNEPSTQELQMYAIDQILGTHGIEGFAYEDFRYGLSYCNSGDTYNTTVTYCSEEDRFRVECYGDAVERAEKEGYIVPEE